MNRSTGCLLLFILSLIAGVVAGYILIRMLGGGTLPPTPTQPPATSTTSQNINSTTGDSSVLIVGVDSLEKTNPLMEGAWLVTLLDNETVTKEACGSIVELARDRDLSNPNRDEFVKALRRVIELDKDASTVKHAKAFIEGAD